MTDKDIKNMVIDISFVDSEGKWHYSARDKVTGWKYTGWVDLKKTAKKAAVNAKVVTLLKLKERRGRVPGQN